MTRRLSNAENSSIGTKSGNAFTWSKVHPRGCDVLKALLTHFTQTFLIKNENITNGWSTAYLILTWQQRAHCIGTYGHGGPGTKASFYPDRNAESRKLSQTEISDEILTPHSRDIMLRGTQHMRDLSDLKFQKAICTILMWWGKVEGHDSRGIVLRQWYTEDFLHYERSPFCLHIEDCY